MPTMNQMAQALRQALEDSPGDELSGAMVGADDQDLSGITIDGYFDLNRACERMLELLVAPKDVPAKLTVALCPHCGRHLMVAEKPPDDTTPGERPGEEGKSAS